MNKHEAVRAALLKTFGELAQDFSGADIQTLFTRVRSLQFSEFDLDIFNLLKNLCRTVIRSAYGYKELPSYRRRGNRRKPVAADDEVLSSHKHRMAALGHKEEAKEEGKPKQQKKKLRRGSFDTGKSLAIEVEPADYFTKAMDARVEAAKKREEEEAQKKREEDEKEEDKELIMELMRELMDYLWGMCRDEAREAGLER